MVDSKILGIDGKEPLLSGTLWGWMKPYVHTRLETRIDLQQPLEELRAVLPAFGIGAPGSGLDGSLASLALEDVPGDRGAVRVRVQMQVPELPAASTTPDPARSHHDRGRAAALADRAAAVGCLPDLKSSR